MLKHFYRRTPNLYTWITAGFLCLSPGWTALASAGNGTPDIEAVSERLNPAVRPLASSESPDARRSLIKNTRTATQSLAPSLVQGVKKEVNPALIRRSILEAADRLRKPNRASAKPRNFARQLNAQQSVEVYQGSNGSYRLFKGEFDAGHSGSLPMTGYDLVNFMKQRETLFALGESSRLEPVADWQGDVLHHQKYQREYKDLPVFGAQVGLHFRENRIYLIHGDFNAIDKNLDVSLPVKPIEAIAAGLSYLDRSFDDLNAPPEISKQVVRVGDRTIVAAVTRLTFADFTGWDVFVDLRTQRVVREIPLHKPVLVDASGIDLQGDVRSFEADERGGKFFLANPEVPKNGTSILDAQNTEGEVLVFSTSDLKDSGWDPAGVSAYVHLRAVYDYFLTSFGRDSVDDRGQELLGVIHFDEAFDNAFWSNPYMVFGDGGGVFSSLAGCLDVVAHEVAHGVIENEANLIYQNQSGALNESFADVFGVMVDRDDWLLGEDCTLAAPGYLRDMANPGLSRSRQPSHMSEFRVLPNTRAGDNGGVHINSGIPNRAAYLMAQGLSEESLGESIGRAATEEILYETLRMLTPDAEFIDAAIVSVTVAEQRYGPESTEAQAVRDAWLEVGISSDNVADASGGSRSIDGVAGEDFMVYLYPEDGTHDNPFDTDETYQIYSQEIPDPFVDYEAALDRGPLNEFGDPAYTPLAPISIGGAALVFYVSKDGNLWGTSVVGDELILDGFGVNSIAAAQDGNRVALTFVDERSILVIDLITGASFFYEALGANYIEGDAVNLVTRVDSVGFDYSGRKVIFDYAACIPVEDSAACTGDDPAEYWSMGILDVESGRFTYPFPTQSSDIDIGYPKFANNTNQYVVFDYLDWTDFAANGQAESLVLLYDIVDKTFSFVGVSNIGDVFVSAYGIPSFAGDDSHIIHQVIGDDFGIAVQVALDDYEANPLDFRLLNPFDVAVPTAFRNGVRAVGASLSSSALTLDFGVLAPGAQISREFVVTNVGNRTVEITNVSTLFSQYTHNIVPTTLLPDASVRYRVQIDSTGLSGILEDGLLIENDGDGGALDVSLAATLLSGVDRDSDGVQDSLDLFPDDPLEQSDFDSDGLGDHADTDDDNDGMTDNFEVKVGLDPRDDDGADDRDGDGQSNLDEFFANTRSVQYLMTTSTSSNVSYLHIINTANVAQRFSASLYDGDGNLLGAEKQPISADIASNGRLVLTSKNLEEIFNITPWSGPAMVEVFGEAAFELMSKLTSPSGLISNTNCVRESQVHNVEGVDSPNQSFVRFINTTNTAVGPVRGGVYSPSGNPVGDTGVVLFETLPPKSAYWLNREDLIGRVGASWSGSATVSVEPVPGLKLLNLNFVNSETFFNFSCHESTQSKTAFLQTSPTSANRSFTDIINSSATDQYYRGTLYNRDGMQLGDADVALSVAPVATNGRLTLTSAELAEVFDVSGWSGPAMLVVAGAGTFEILTRLTSPSGLVSNANCVRQDQVHNIEGFESPNRSFVRLINRGDGVISNVRGSLFDVSGQVIGQQDLLLAEELPAKSAVWLDREQLGILTAVNWTKEASLVLTAPDPDLRLLNLNFVNDETFFNFSCYEALE